MIRIRELRKKDYQKACDFAQVGMHFEWFVKNKFLLKLYTKSFWYEELNQATRAYGAYIGDRFVGVLLAEVKGEPKRYYSKLQSAYIRIVKLIEKIFAGGAEDPYDLANQRMYRSYCKNNSPDVQICFLAADPNCKIRGIGSKLLSALESDLAGKQIYLYTDNSCTYQFYEKRGFTREENRDILIKYGKKEIPLQCFLYSKKLD
ncbi:MAG: GNAT family N-acetyltransferase [Lachnospiraceae bacterium]|nr:GNAT family N-acetyltransferase [Lachnospiraceae bacterium]